MKRGENDMKFLRAYRYLNEPVLTFRFSSSLQPIPESWQFCFS
ncbi:MAG: hypothetical protein M2R46_05620 [Verrucomicrobia subdivision 3 bacterium]|nr:hypothetical protein [Limisphaerales bacterium]